MNDWSLLLTQHGYGLLFLVILLQSFGFPVPAGLALIVSGAAVATGALRIDIVLGGSFATMAMGDSLMYFLGRSTGWWFLGILCRLSLNPEACILRSAETFQRRGRRLLMVSKFVPGLNSMAPPLAGSMQMRYLPFLRSDIVGMTLYVGAYFAIGFSGSSLLAPLLRGYQTFGHILMAIGATAIAIYGAFQLRLYLRERGLKTVAYALPAEIPDIAAEGSKIYDVRSHGYFDPGAIRIKGSQRLDPYALHELGRQGGVPPHVYVYCTCIREATSRRVARELESHAALGLRVTVIKGGLSAWRKAGLATETVPPEEVTVLPVFA
jgi:membrane protein DedA with SNARE-associated domain/rhodanese-related sulfurtransferase